MLLGLGYWRNILNDLQNIRAVIYVWGSILVLFTILVNKFILRQLFVKFHSSVDMASGCLHVNPANMTFLYNFKKLCLPQNFFFQSFSNCTPAHFPFFLFLFKSYKFVSWFEFSKGVGDSKRILSFSGPDLSPVSTEEIQASLYLQV